MIQQQALIVAMLLKAVGTKARGGYEVFIPNSVASDNYSLGTIEESRDFLGITLRYMPNTTILAKREPDDIREPDPVLPEVKDAV
jgi:hypothetical protein